MTSKSLTSQVRSSICWGSNQDLYLFIRIGVRTESEYRNRLNQLCKAKKDHNPNEWIFTWGYHSLFHGQISRSILDEICPTRPLVVWHRSFHALHLNSKAMQKSGLCELQCKSEPHIDWNEGHFSEQGMVKLIEGLKLLLELFPKIEKGYELVSKAVKAGGITTVADMEVYYICSQVV